MLIFAIPDERAARDPDGPCIADARHVLNNAAFAAAVRAMAGRLAARGIGRGSIVAAMLPNRVELIVSMFAAWRIGAALTPVNPALTAAEAGLQIVDSRARLVVADAESARKLSETGAAVLAVDEVLRDNGAAAPPYATEPEDIALVIYTSGSTGRPKGVILDHANLAATTELIVSWFGFTADTRCLLVLPLFHVNGIMVSVVSALAAGGTSVVAERFDAATFWEQVERVRPTFFSAVPTMYALLAAQPREAEPDTSSLRFVICGAAPMPAELIGRFEKRFGVPVVEGYGLSECTLVCTANPPLGLRKPGTVGLPLPGVEVAVVDDRDRALPRGESGEVVVRGPNVMRGYLRLEEETARTLRGGWLHTGDVGFFDADGYLVLVDRLKDLIIRGGENISPSEIEHALHLHPAVLEVAVVGRPSDVYGEEPVAFVSLAPARSADPGELIAHCRETLARFKVPRDVFIEQALPKTPVGKIDKPALRTLLRGRAINAVR
jgi:acyl-CoA synthetase (AMP-forming)/AMP-acid ligase II